MWLAMQTWGVEELSPNDSVCLSSAALRRKCIGWGGAGRKSVARYAVVAVELWFVQEVHLVLFHDRSWLDMTGANPNHLKLKISKLVKTWLAVRNIIIFSFEVMA